MKAGSVVIVAMLFMASALLATGGENCGSATVIDSLPYWDETSSTGFSNDYSLSPSGCTGHTTLGPDAVYSYTVPYGSDTFCVMLSVIIPQDYWNVAIYVLEDSCPNPITTCVAGADEYGPGSPEAITSLTLTGGHTYYFVVDGRDTSDYGAYKIGLSDCVVGLDESFYYDLNKPTLLVSPTIIGNKTMISYSVPTSLKGSINVMDISGRVVKTLIQGDLSGSSSVIWNLANSNIDAGVYFVRLKAGNFQKTQRVVVIR